MNNFDQEADREVNQTKTERTKTMAAVPVTISGVLYDKKGRTVQNVTLIGLASLTDVQIGGGPVIPESPTGDPPGIWQDPGGYNPNDPGAPWPPEQPAEGQKLITWKAVWSEDTGWVVVGTPNVPHPTPSKR